MNNLPENITHETIIAYLDGKSTKEEAGLIEAWILSSEDNKQYFEDIKAVWTETGKLDPAPVAVNVDNAWAKLSSRIEAENREDENIPPAEKGKVKTLYKMFFRIAAVLVIGLFVTYLLIRQGGEIKQVEVATAEQTVQKQLSDGSVINLNTNSKLTYPEKFAKNIREVNLEGEAFFKVSHDKGKPFVIHSDGANIKVLGTSFNVKAYKDDENVEVFVKEGKVMLYCIDISTGDTNQVVLTAGEKGWYDHQTKKVYKAEKADENELFWITKTLVFDKTELSDVAVTLENYYNVKIKLKNSRAAGLRLTATFEGQPVDTVLDIISTSLNLKVSKINSTYEIDGEGN